MIKLKALSLSLLYIRSRLLWLDKLLNYFLYLKFSDFFFLQNIIFIIIVWLWAFKFIYLLKLFKCSALHFFPGFSSFCLAYFIIKIFFLPIGFFIFPFVCSEPNSNNYAIYSKICSIVAPNRFSLFSIFAIRCYANKTIIFYCCSHVKVDYLQSILFHLC